MVRRADPDVPVGGPDRSSPCPVRRVTTARARWWTELLVVLGLCWAYDAVNNLAAMRRGQAFNHGYSLLQFEQRLHIAPELSLNRWLVAHHAIGLLVSDWYDLLHFAVTLSLLAWLWWRHPGRYRPLRNTLIGINLIGFAVFWLYPLAPPRMLASAGFVDVVAVRHAVGAWSSGVLASQANELAAMPSLHMAWAVWCSLAVRSISGRRAVRWAAWMYPVATAVIVIATANHYLLDVVAGVLTTVVAGGAARWLMGLWARRSPAGAEAALDTIADRATPGDGAGPMVATGRSLAADGLRPAAGWPADRVHVNRHLERSDS